MLVALGSTAAAYTQTSIISVGIGIILILGAWYLTKEVVGSKAALENVRETEGEEAAKVIATIMENESRQPDGKKKKRNVLKDFFMLFANKYWVINMGTVLANGVGIGFMFGVATYFAKYVLGNTASFIRYLRNHVHRYDGRYLYRRTGDRKAGFPYGRRCGKLYRSCRYGYFPHLVFLCLTTCSCSMQASLYARSVPGFVMQSPAI